MPLVLFLILSILPLAAVDFSSEVRPILNAHCTACHGGVKQQGGVSFLYREQVLGTGDSGKPTVVPFSPEKSELIKRIVTDDEDSLMPQPDHGRRLNEHEVATLTAWVEEGAEWGRHWSFEPVKKQPAPTIKDTSWPKAPVDHFILAKLEQLGLDPNKPAPADRLLRRLHLDLTGIPPTIDQLDDFATAYKSDPDQAVAAAIDRLLSEPAFGEKWTTMWLDLARYADSEGLGADRPWSVWPYRDWVIKAFNDDLPYNDFLVKQLAGDLLPDASLSDHVATAFHRLTQQNNEGGTDNEEFRTMAVLDRANTTWSVLQGITFECIQCHDHPYDPIRHDEFYQFAAFFNNTRDADLADHHPRLRLPNKDAEVSKVESLRAEIDPLTNQLFAESQKVLQRASWHPITKLNASANKVKTETVSADGYTEWRPVGTIPVGVIYDVTIQVPDDVTELTALRLHTLPPEVDAARHSPPLGAFVTYFELKKDGEKVALRHAIGDDPRPHRPDFTVLKNNTNGWGAKTHQNHPRTLAIVLAEPMTFPADSDRTLTLQIHHKANAPTGPLAIKRGRIDVTSSPEVLAWTKESLSQRRHLGSLERQLQKLTPNWLPIMAERPASLAREMRTFVRGNWLEKGDTIHQPGTPATFHPLPGPTDQPATRLQMAQWLASPDNPLTSRVLVTRVWEQLFGLGLVETLEDFGSAGLPPSHPALLDDLAARFQSDHNWSLKGLLRELVSSATYRQSAQITSQKREKDPRNVYLSRGPRQRLSAELIRDHHLAASGLLHQKIGGKPVYPPLPGGVWKPFSGERWPTAKIGDPNRYRRALYTFRKRSIPHPSFDAFDAPTRENCAPRRQLSNTPLGALVTLNDESFAETAAALAKRMATEGGATTASQINYGHRLATSLKPSLQKIRTLQNLYHPENELPHLQIATVLLNLDDALTK